MLIPGNKAERERERRRGVCFLWSFSEPVGFPPVCYFPEAIAAVGSLRSLRSAGGPKSFPTFSDWFLSLEEKITLSPN